MGIDKENLPQIVAEIIATLRSALDSPNATEREKAVRILMHLKESAKT